MNKKLNYIKKAEEIAKDWSIETEMHFLKELEEFIDRNLVDIIPLVIRDKSLDFITDRVKSAILNHGVPSEW
jgi:hypothetical protein